MDTRTIELRVQVEIPDNDEAAKALHEAIAEHDQRIEHLEAVRMRMSLPTGDGRHYIRPWVSKVTVARV